MRNLNFQRQDKGKKKKIKKQIKKQPAFSQSMTTAVTKALVCEHVVGKCHKPELT